MDQGRKIRPGVDAAFMPRVCGQLGEAAVVCAGVQSWEHPSEVRTAAERGSVDADEDEGKLIKIGAEAVRHARVVTYQMAEVAVPRRLFLWKVARIGRLRASPG